MLTPKTDIDAHVKVQNVSAQVTAAGAAIALVAGATEDGVKVARATGIDCKGYESAVVMASGIATLQDTETLSLAIEYQTSADNSTFDAAVVLQASTVVATGETGGTDEPFEVQLPLNLSGLKRYVKVNVTPAMSAGSLDDAIWSADLVLGGAQVLPAA